MVFASARLRGHLWRNTAASSLALERHQKSAIVSLYNFKKYQSWHSQTLLGRREVCTENTLWRRVSPFILLRHLALHFAKDCSPTGQEQACTRIIWLFGCSLVCLMSPCRKWPNTQENGCWQPPSDHIHSWNPFPDQTRKEEWLVQPVICVVDTGSCSFSNHFRFYWRAEYITKSK